MTDTQRPEGKRLMTTRDRLRDALALTQAVLTDEKDDKVNRARLVCDTALAGEIASDDHGGVGRESDWTRAQALRWRRERDSAREVLRVAVEELDNWREKGSAVMRDELVDDFIAAAKKELRRSA